jgi:MFS superfamily sulfate permease-like transporter
VVAAEPITDIDATASEALATLHDELLDSGVELAFAELKDPVRDVLRRYGVEQQIGEQRFFPTSASRSPPMCARQAFTGGIGRIGRPRARRSAAGGAQAGAPSATRP